MAEVNVFQRVTGFSNLEVFSKHVSGLSPMGIEKIREMLFKQFDAVVEYKDAAEWSDAVALCEALAAIGWGSRERVDATTHFNGDCWDTYFRNAKGKERFLKTRWSKRKQGWNPFNPEYFWSPDRPEIPNIDWRHYCFQEAPLVDMDNLPTQSNYQKQCPIIMGMIGGGNEVCDCIFQLKKELHQLLIEYLRPEAYGSDLEHFYLTLNGPFLDTEYESHLEIGSFRPKQKSYYCKLYFASTFANLDRASQIAYFQSNLLKAIEVLQEKVVKKKYNCNLTVLREDLNKVFNHWHSQTAPRG